MTGDADVVIAGGGLIGLAIGWRLTQRGRHVTIVDSEHGTSGASHAAAGMLAPVSEATYGEEPLLRLGLASLERYPAFVAELEAESGRRVGLRTAGTLEVGFDADDIRQIEALFAFRTELGLEAERLTPGQARRLEPALTPRLRGAVHVASDYSVDARALREALRAVLAPRLRVGTIAALKVEDGRAVGVSLADGTQVRGRDTVLALGAASGRLPGAPALPVRPVGGQILRLRGAEGLLSGTVRALVRGRTVYLVPYGADGLVVGATVEEKGFRSVVTAGGVYELLRDAIEVVPGVTELELAETIVRYRPATPDNAPLLGVGELPGLYVAAGHYRNGVLLTPVTADAMSALIVDGALPDVAAGFSPSRFDPALTR